MAPSEETLARSNAISRWSFSTDAYLGPTTPPPPTQNPLPLVDVQQIEPWNATPWSINLNAWQYKGGNVGVAPAIGAPWDQANGIYSQATVYAVLEFGVDGSIEQVLVDWPPRGATLQVNAAYLRMGVTWRNDFLFAAPKFSGYVAPAPAPRFNQLWCHPRFTDIRVFGPSTINVVGIPVRAVAYRIALQLNNNTPAAYNVEQMAAAGAGTVALEVQDGIVGQDVSVILNANDRTNRQAYIPIMSRTQYLQITTTALGGNTFHIEYLLDLG